MVGIRVLVAITIAHLSSYYCASQADMVRVRLGWAKSSKAGLNRVRLGWAKSSKAGLNRVRLGWAYNSG